MTESQTRVERQITPLRSAFLIGALLVAAAAGIALRGSAAEVAHTIPAPAVDGQAATDAPAAASEVAVLAGGCFWGVQGVFQHVNGVINAVFGLCGRRAEDRPL
jgi:peptide-methionine (S)-S-oxide reductase